MDRDVLDRFDKLWGAINAINVDVAVLTHKFEDLEGAFKRLERKVSHQCGCEKPDNGVRNRRVKKYAVAGGGGIAAIVILLETMVGYLR